MYNHFFSILKLSHTKNDIFSKFQSHKKLPEWSSRISSSNSPESKSESPKDQVEKQKKFQCVGIYWVLLSLVVTVFWGKVNVTIWTSLLLFFFFIWNAICSSCGTQNPRLEIVRSRSHICDFLCNSFFFFHSTLSFLSCIFFSLIKHTLVGGIVKTRVPSHIICLIHHTYTDGGNHKIGSLHIQIFMFSNMCMKWI